MNSIVRLLKRYLYIMRERRVILASLVGAFLFNALLDVLGIFSIATFFQFLTNEELAESSQLSLFAQEYGGIEDTNIVIISLGVFSILAFSVKAVLAYVVNLGVLRFSFKKRMELQRFLFDSYMKAPLGFFLTRNFTHMTHYCNYMTNAFISFFSGSLINLVSNLILVTIIALWLAKSHFLLTLSITFLFGGMSALYYWGIKDRSARYASTAAENGKKMNLTVKEGLYSLNETRILGCEKYFYDKVRGFQENAFINDLRSKSLTMIPRPMAELMFILFIVGFTIVHYLVQGDILSVSAKLAAFGFAGLRMVPAVSNISAAMQGLKSYSFVVHELYDEVTQIEAMLESEKELSESLGGNAGAESFDFANEVCVEDLHFRYPGLKEDVIQGLNFKIKKGTSIALIGKSGSGKSTLINLLLGRLTPSAGSISLGGISIHRNIEGWHRLISYLPQVIHVLDDSVTRNVAFGVRDEEIDMERLKWSIQEAQLDELVEQLPEGLKTKLGDNGERISGGQRQRIGIARALYHQREILIMDEATSALDEETEAQIKESLHRLKGKLTVIMITHHLYDPDSFDHVYRMEKGRLVDRKA